MEQTNTLKQFKACALMKKTLPLLVKQIIMILNPKDLVKHPLRSKPEPRQTHSWMERVSWYCLAAAVQEEGCVSCLSTQQRRGPRRTGRMGQFGEPPSFSFAASLPVGLL